MQSIQKKTATLTLTDMEVSLLRVLLSSAMADSRRKKSTRNRAIDLYFKILDQDSDHIV